jgi:methylated-DNA-[protein]-cysteine S-methyltransferase
MTDLSAPNRRRGGRPGRSRPARCDRALRPAGDYHRVMAGRPDSPQSRGFALFETAIGLCGVAWDGPGLVGVQLPAATRTAALARLASLRPGLEEQMPPFPPAIDHAITRIRALLEGGRVSLADIVLDLDGVTTFERRVYEVTRAIGPGETLTYGEVATRLGDPGLSRAVGQALGRNPFPVVVPCHRVVAADGGLGGFSAPGGAATKRQLLAIETVQAILPW